jgi:chloramphenicol O-acetyltransferase type A
MPRYLDLDSWPRRGVYDFFRGYDNPYFNVCAPVDVTALAARCRGERQPFSLGVLHALLGAANECESFRYRLDGDRVLVHDRLHCATTALLAGERLAFLYFDFDDDFAAFRAGAERARAAVEAGGGAGEGAEGAEGAGGAGGAGGAESGAGGGAAGAGGGAAGAGRGRPGLDARDERTDLIHFTSLPWLAFTSVSHPRNWGREDSVPKIAIGRHQEAADGTGRRLLPLSVEVHHALMDGVHVARFYERVQERLGGP